MRAGANWLCTLGHRLSLSLDDIAEPGARAFELDTQTGRVEGFVVRYAGQLRAYINSCPHTGVGLNWSEDQFFEPDHNFIQCSMHGALFEPLTGLCVWGPCRGRRLQSLIVELVDGQLLIYI